MANRARACALERLAPFYRERMVGALARALADDDEGSGLEYLVVLEAGEIKRAHLLAAAMRARRDAALLERRPTRRSASIKKVVRRLVDLICRRNT